MNLLITGGTGFFGRALIRWLAQQCSQPGGLPYERVTIVSRSPDAFRARFPELAALPWIHWHRGDIQDPASLPNRGQFERVLHAAADSTDAAGLTPLQRFDQIVNGTRNMLEFAVQRNTHRFLLTSSGGAYGSQPREMFSIPETYCGMPDSLNSSSAYGIAKRQAEHLCALYSEQFGLKTVIARCFAFVGEDLPLNSHFAIGNFIRDALFKESIFVNGDGSPLRSYLDQTDLAHWLFSILERGKPGNAYNVGSDQAISIGNLAHLVRDLIAPDHTVQIKGALVADNIGRNRYIPNVEKSINELGLHINVPLADAIQNTAKTHRK